MSKSLDRLKMIQEKMDKAQKLKDISEYKKQELENLLAENGFGSIEEVEAELHDLSNIMEEEEKELNRRIEALTKEIEGHLNG